MKEGSSALTKGLNRKAVDSFKKALDSISSSLPEAREKVKISYCGSYCIREQFDSYIYFFFLDYQDF